MGLAIRIEDYGAVRNLVLCRADEFNTITPELRNELDAALDDADRDSAVKVVLITAEGRAFCAGFGLDWSTAAPAAETDMWFRAPYVCVASNGAAALLFSARHFVGHMTDAFGSYFRYFK